MVIRLNGRKIKCAFARYDEDGVWGGGVILPHSSSFSVNLIDSMQSNVQLSHSHAHAQRFFRNHMLICAHKTPAHEWMLYEGKLWTILFSLLRNQDFQPLNQKIFGQSFNSVDFKLFLIDRSEQTKSKNDAPTEKMSTFFDTCYLLFSLQSCG